jgi:hypothetical protein
LAIIIEGTRRVGGVGLIYDRLVETDRIEFFEFIFFLSLSIFAVKRLFKGLELFFILSFDPSPFKRHTFWSIMIGGFFTSLTVYGSNQATIQRYLALPSIRAAQL